jgi:hypothetical protein
VDNHRQQLGAFVSANPAEHFEAVHLGQLEIQQHDRRQRFRVVALSRDAAVQDRERLGTVARNDHFVGDTALLEREQRQFLVAGIVFDQQDQLVHVVPFLGPDGTVNVKHAPPLTLPSAQMRPP